LNHQINTLKILTIALQTEAHLSLKALVAREFNEIFSGRQTLQNVKVFRLHFLMRLSAKEKFIEDGLLFNLFRYSIY